MDKTTRLIKWQRITICILVGGFMTAATYDRIQQRDVRSREETALRNVKFQLAREKRYRAMEREQHDREVNGWRNAAHQSLDALMYDQDTIGKQCAVLGKYKAKYGLIDPTQEDADICTGVSEPESRSQ